MQPVTNAEALKSCCSGAYESEFARLLLGDSFHPGGLHLTRRLGDLLGLRPGLRVLDIASGRGESAIFLAKEFGCEVVGIDFSPRNTEQASARAAKAGVEHLVRFAEGDAERIAFPDAVFDHVISECAFCTFPNKIVAAREMGRVLRPEGRIGIGDLTRQGALPANLNGLISWIACVADALPVADYSAALAAASFHTTMVETHNGCLLQMAQDVEGRLLGLELLAGLKKLDLPGVDLSQAKQFARSAKQAIKDGILGYALIVASRGDSEEARS